MNLTNYMESVQNPEGRFRTLQGVFAVKDNGRPRMAAGAESVVFEVVVGGVPHIMRCFFASDTARDERMRELSAYTGHIACPHLVPQLFLEGEMLVFDNFDRPVWADILLQRVPDGERLDRLTSPPEGLVAGFARLSEWLATNDFSHGNICAKNVWVASDGTPVLVDYTHGSRRRSAADLRAVEALVAALDDVSATAPATVPKYVSIGEMHDGMMCALDGREWIYIDKTGAQAIEGRFLSAKDFDEGRAVVEVATGYGLIDVDGRWIVAPHCEDVSWDSVHNVAIVTANGLSGLVNRAGEPLTEVAYDQIMEGKEGLFAVRQGRRFGFLGKDGTMAIAPQFDDALSFRDGHAKVRLGGEYFLIDREGVIVQKINELA
jgi:hypothetical protein